MFMNMKMKSTGGTYVKRINAIGGVMIMAISFLFLTLGVLPAQEKGKDAETLAWQEALKKNNELAIDNFLTKFPSGLHAEEARNRKEEMVWERTEKLKYFSGYEKYLNSYPNGKFVSQARARVEELKIKKCTKPTAQFLTNMDDHYESWIVTNYKKFIDAQNTLTGIFAGGSLLAALEDQREMRRVWFYCYQSKATAEETKNYSEICSKTDNLANKLKEEMSKKGKKK
jgi:hypothetical protein